MKIRKLKMNEFIWLRIGDAGEYQKFDNPEKAGDYLGDSIFFSKPLQCTFLTFRSGIEITPGFTGLNYISLFWGDGEAQRTHDLSKKDRKNFLKALKFSLKENQEVEDE